MKMKKTSELGFELENTQSIYSFIKENESEFDEKNFYDFLATLVRESGKSKTKIVDGACISEPYLYDILRGEKRPSRDTVIKLAFGLAVDAETASRLMMLAGYSGFYLRRKRDALLQFALQNNMNIMEAEVLLAKHGFTIYSEINEKRSRWS